MKFRPLAKLSLALGLLLSIPLTAMPTDRAHQTHPLPERATTAAPFAGTITLASTLGSQSIEAEHYSRITDSDLHLVLLSRIANDWSDAQYVRHLYGSPSIHRNEFDKMDMHAKALASIPEYRVEVAKLGGVHQFRIGVIGTELRKQTLASALGMSVRNPYRFRLMRGYTEDDLSSIMTAGPFDFSTSSFPVSGGYLPCDNTRIITARYGHLKPPLAFAFRTWIQGKPPRTMCQVQIQDEKSARKIEEARHSGTLVIGVVIYARMSGLIEDNAYVIEVDRVDFDFYRDPGSARYFRHLGSSTLTRP